VTGRGAEGPPRSAPPEHILGDLDRELLRGAAAVVGIDEVGRGALAGPVVVGAVLLTDVPRGITVRDSKTMTARQREAAASRLRRECRQWAVCEVGVELIDRVNILEATRLAMRSVAAALASGDSVVVTDNLDLGAWGCRVLSPKGADGLFFSVAAASIIAKVHRDRLMVEIAGRDPRWGWDRNKGYGTVAHRRALDLWGRSRLHRQSFTWTPVLP
jgi:ribonuclease HII